MEAMIYVLDTDTLIFMIRQLAYGCVDRFINSLGLHLGS